MTKRPAVVRLPVDKEWFVKKLADKDKSASDLARYLETDRSTVSLYLSGKRRLQLPEVDKIARFLDVPVEDVLAHAGLKGKARRQNSVDRDFKIVGIVNADMTITTIDGDFVPGPSDLPDDAVAVRVQTAGTHADHMDGWVLYYQPSKGIQPAHVTRFCVAELAGGEKRLVGNLRLGYEPGTYNMVVAGALIENLSITCVAQVLLIRP